MTNTLVLKSSILGPHSQSNQLIDHALEGKSGIIERDLAATPLPVLDMNVATALRSDGNDLSDDLKAVLELSNQLIDELKAADTIVIGAPMYNFMVPTQLKNWFDLIARAGVTFSYTETGPVGLIENKKVIVVTTRGGLHKDSPRNSIESYLTTMLGFIGITDVEFVYAEALNMGEDAAAVAREDALKQLAELV
ncbi:MULTISPECIES: FMN-dependent NADH-azoreductase [Vibrio]|uniref:FMN-dependent NADH-azoreductase n=1 Tax=Vibrio TaxID=662 RepID=UPI0009C1DB74|nr:MULTISPECIES: FMN-dependent NADH-azoreductase [unclassified Vibrio]ARC94837.1 FMN-dependent NADH-azoreductase [Vibrio coralliilyticus]MCM5507674.1 FMN-dependent NADH-azoreductase [Vibrio sp. SCSIO 43169]MDE3899440.1 FMN-dependent NADH-azoreductase [Vibrio sp. CC007]QFT38881.1 FMN-dependent NADH-azoreductase [Vibrio sp. THAF64]QGM36582.1 FMN-dependent NADH-azoreductase [Vibrio sp. THAF191d]